MLTNYKTIWTLNNYCKHLHDLVEDGLTHKVCLDGLDNLDQKYFRKTKIDTEDFYDTENLSDTIRKQVLAEL